MKIINNEIIADEDLVLHLLNSDSYFSRCYLIDGLTESNFEEITREEYDKIIKEKEEEYGKTLL